MTTRRLAAILAADVAGYSRLMAADEAGTLARFNALKAEVIGPKIAEFKGTVVGSAGDSLLIEFPSVVDAVQCAVETQERIAERNAGEPEDRRIVFRMGINLGDVIAEGTTIHGDGVNVASRLERLAEPGSVVIALAVHQQVKGKLQYNFADLGEHRVKNIAEPVRAYRVGAAALESSPRGAVGTPAASSKPSIAVLPFTNMSGDPEQEYFSDGIAEDIITALSRFHSFFVISRNSTFTYKGKSVDVRQVARELGVRYVLEGSVRKAGNRARVTAQLIDASSDHHVWGERYDRVLEDIFEIQDEITQSIVAAVAPEFMAAEIGRARRKEVPNLDAWELVARARWHINQFTKEDILEARNLLSKALERDPGNSLALTGLAVTHLWDWTHGWSDEPARSLSDAEKAAKSACAFDRGDAYAHAILGAVELYSDRPEDALRHAEQAIALNSNDPSAHSILGRTLVYAGEVGKGLEHVERAIKLSPRDSFVTLWYSALSIGAFIEERYGDAMKWAKEAITAQPNRSPAYLDLAASCAELGLADAAAEALARYFQLAKVDSVAATAIVHRFRRPADRARYLGALDKAGRPR